MERCASVCVWRGLSPKASQAPSGSPGVSSSPQTLGFRRLGLAGCWGSPCLPPPAQPRGPHPCPRPPTPAPTLGGRPAPLRVAPLTSRRGWGGAGPAPGSAAAAGRGSALRPPAAQGTPGPGRPLPSPPAAQTPGCAPTPGQSPSLHQGTPRTAPAVYPSQGLSSLSLSLPLSLPPCLSLSLPQGLWASASRSPKAFDSLPVSL